MLTALLWETTTRSSDTTNAKPVSKPMDAGSLHRMVAIQTKHDTVIAIPSEAITGLTIPTYVSATGTCFASWGALETAPMEI
jgi:hypothetical protein